MSADPPIDPKLLDAAVELMGRSGGSGRVRVQGDSMRPMLRPGDVLEVAFKGDPPRTGDLLLFRQADYLVVHRLLGRARRQGGEVGFRTRGDASMALDPRVAEGSVLGRVVAFERGSERRELKGRRARGYARAMAWHGFCWAALAAVARRIDRGLGRGRAERSFERLVRRVDRRLLRLVHGAVFDRLHPLRSLPPDR